MSETPAVKPKDMDEALEWMRFGCPFAKTFGIKDGIADFDVKYFERRMQAAADFIESALTTAEQRLAAVKSELADANASYASQLKEIHELRNLIRLIFESTPPYNDGQATFSDKVTDEFNRLFPNEFDAVIDALAGGEKG